MHILVVEDSERMRALLDEGLNGLGHRVTAVEDGEQALLATHHDTFDTVVLDVNLPGIDGFAVVRALRSRRDWTPVLMLTARDGVPDRVAGLDQGADDYLVKPFAFTELDSRLRALDRRGRAETPDQVLRCGPVALDPASRSVTCRDQPVQLTAREFDLLEFLLRHPSQVLTRPTIIEHVWDHAYDGGSNVVDVYIGYLRDKVGRPHDVEFIRTIRGVGYQAVCDQSA